MENKELTMKDRLEALKDNRFHIHRKEIGDHAERHTEDKSDDIMWNNAARSYAKRSGWTDWEEEYKAWAEYVRLLFMKSGHKVNDYFNGL